MIGHGLTLPPATSAQSGTTGSLSGVVQDPNGAVLPGVQVTLRNPGTGLSRNTTTNHEGRWTFPALPVGAYELTYEVANFRTLKRSNVEVEAAVPRTFEDKLEVAGVSDETVTVVEGGAAFATPDTSAVARQLSAEQIVAVPTSTRSFTQLLSAEAGVNTDLSPVLTNGNGNQSPAVNGTRTTSTSLSFNGVDATNITSNEGSLNNNIAPAPETLSEVKLQTSLYDASTGRSGGGNFQLITRSGTNEFHGSGYFFIQNEKFNANDFFFNKDGIPRPKARRNEGGFTIGGPLVKDRFHFFGGYQRTQAITGFVPTASSITVLPQALGLIGGERTKQKLFDAFRSLNPGITASIPNADAISDVAVRLLNLRNPATGDFVIPAPRLSTGVNDPRTGFIVASNARPTGFASVDSAIAATTAASTKHTLHGQDWNNFAPRIGFAYSPFGNSRMVVRGGYGLFYDRPSAASPICLTSASRRRATLSTSTAAAPSRTSTARTASARASSSTCRPSAQTRSS